MLPPTPLPPASLPLICQPPLPSSPHNYKPKKSYVLILVTTPTNSLETKVTDPHKTSCAYRRCHFPLPPFDISRHRLSQLSIKPPINPLQHKRAPRHRRRATSIKYNPFHCPQLVQQRVRVKPIVGITVLQPEPVSNRKSCRGDEGREDANSPRRREKECVDQEEDGGE